MKKAFTLVELAIVLVIIGLLTAGVVGGQSLIESAKVNKVVAEQKEIMTAMQAFRLEYGQLPGDFNQATSYWSGTGNGNKDGAINSGEPLNFFSHMTLAGILPNNYISSHYKSNYGDNAIWYTHKPNVNVFSQSKNFLALTHFNCAESWCSTMTTKNTKAVDTKIDDGNASLGRVLGLTGQDSLSAGASSYCNSWDGTGANDWTKEGGSVNYKLATTNKACRPFFSLN